MDLLCSGSIKEGGAGFITLVVLFASPPVIVVNTLDFCSIQWQAVQEAQAMASSQNPYYGQSSCLHLQVRLPA